MDQVHSAEDSPINTREELVAILNQITFKNSVLDFKWKFEVEEEPIGVRVGNGPNPALNIRVGWTVYCSFERPDTITGTIGRGRGRDEIIWKGTSLSGVVKTAWLLVELLVRHELMEGFRWNGQRIFNPHNSVVDLARLQIDHESSWK